MPVYKQCRTEQSAQRQRDLEQGLLKTMLKKQFEEISVSDLCAEIGVPRKSFYRYFSGKEGALFALIDHALMDFDSYSVVENITELQEAQKYMERVFRYWISCKPLLDALEHSGLSGMLVQRAINYSREMQTLPSFLLAADRRLQDYGSMFTVCGLMTILVQWHHDGFVPGVEQMSGLVIRLMSEPLFSPAEEK